MLLAGLCLVALSMGARWWVLPEAGPTVIGPRPDASPGGPSLQRARAVLGPPPSGGPWHSGIWAGGGTARTTRVDAFGTLARDAVRCRDPVPREDDLADHSRLPLAHLDLRRIRRDAGVRSADAAGRGRR